MMQRNHSLGGLGASVLLVLAGLLSSSAASPAPADRLKVVCTIQDLADVVKEIGGDRVQVTTIARGKENLHQVQARPSHLIAVSRADVFVQIGLSLESTFVPALLEGARNPKIQPGQPGFVNVSQGWGALDVPTSLSRQSGDVHPQGNPHMNLDPRAGRHMADRVLAGLSAVDPRSKEAYAKRHEEYVKRLGAAEERWSAAAKAWKGRKIVVYHKEYDYLAALYGLQILGTIEARPGIPPTPNHIAGLVETMRREKADAILTAVWSNNDNVAQVAKATRTRVVELPNQCGALAGAETWIGMMDVIHQRLADAFGPEASPR